MNIPRVSFGSLMVFTINDGKPKASVPQLVKIAFNNNPVIRNNYYLSDTVEFSEKIDGTVYKAADEFAERLDDEYSKQLPKGSKKVILTSADFYVNPRETEKRYFLTAATDDDEEKLHNILSKSSAFYVNKFGYKRY